MNKYYFNGMFFIFFIFFCGGSSADPYVWCSWNTVSSSPPGYNGIPTVVKRCSLSNGFVATHATGGAPTPSGRFCTLSYTNHYIPIPGYSCSQTPPSSFIRPKKTCGVISSDVCGWYTDDDVLDKPVIYVEGYDPNNEVGHGSLYYQGFTKFIYEGRDLVVVSFPDGAASLDENAIVLQNVIQEIGAKKIGNHPIAVIGYSMGGIVAKKSLKRMESMGINHKVSLYVSYDAPHMGANLPISIQETVDKIIREIDEKLFGYTPSFLQRSRKIYNSQAAREMLIAAPQHQVAAPSSFPNNVVRVAVTSGSMVGIAQQQSTNLNQLISSFKVSIERNWYGSWSVDSQFISKNRGGVYYDNVPGSYEYFFDKVRNELASSANGFTEYHHTWGRQITFVPTLSALAMTESPLTSARSLFRTRSPFDRYIAADTTSGTSAHAVFHSQWSSGSNQPHSYFHPSQMDQIKVALDEYHYPGFTIPDRSFKSY